MRRILLCLLLCGACGDNLAVRGDAGVLVDAARLTDAAEVRDGAPSLAWIDFTGSGCQLDPGDGDAGPNCAGASPLTVTFHPLAPGEVEEYRWRFGDEMGMTDPVETPIPIHTYALPGTYDVSLSVSGPGGSNAVSKDGFIVVNAADLGSACTLDAQCDAGECVCSDGTCPPALQTGMCSMRCGALACEDGVCADLAPAAGTTDDWHDELCVQDCASEECLAPLTCQSLRAKAGGWVRGCFAPGLLAPVGGSCRDELGVPDPSRCASDTCLDEGARGLCSAACLTSAECPEDSVCATFGGALGSRCIARCDAFACDQDPWLGCEAPGITAPRGFTVPETPSAAGYCAPKRCTVPGDCGPDGDCVASYCAAKP